MQGQKKVHDFTGIIQRINRAHGIADGSANTVKIRG